MVETKGICAMVAPLGNQFWKLRTRHGRKAMFENADKFYDACVEYFQWCDDNPLQEEQVNFYKGKPVRTTVSKMRIKTIGGLCLYLGMNEQTFYKWGKEDNRLDLSEVIEWAKTVCRENNVAGASAGLLKENIIARVHGLAEKQVMNVENPEMVINPPEGERPPSPPIHDEE